MKSPKTLAHCIRQDAEKLNTLLLAAEGLQPLALNNAHMKFR
jgi:hypothetical protein